MTTTLSSFSADIQSFMSGTAEILQIAEEELAKWNYDSGCYQIPLLMTALRARLNWDEKQMRRMDPIMRQFISVSSIYICQLGAKGGITLRELQKQKEQVKIARAQAKVEVLAAIDAAVAKKVEESANTANVVDTGTVTVRSQENPALQGGDELRR